MIQYLKKIQTFIEVDLWRVNLNLLPRRKRYLFRFIKVWVIAIKEFINDRCTEKASALTYLSMLSLVPVLALLFAIAKAFGIRELVESELELYFKGQTEVLEKVIPFVENILTVKGGGILAVSSAVFLLYTVIRLLMNIEEAFNDMWDIKKSRRWERKISDYVAVILLGPILMIVASTATVFVKDTFQEFITSIEFLGEFRSSLVFLIKLIPYTILWFLLFGLYLIFPNTRVKFWPALFAGIVAGTLYQLNQQAFISLQFAFARYDAIYGSVAFLPLFLIWLQISWLIVLFGAEVCYGAQYQHMWEMNSESLKMSLSHRKKLAILILYRVVKKFENGEGGATINDIGGTMNVPRRYVSDICFDLENSGLIVRVEGDETSYQPAFDIHKMDLYTVLQKYEDNGMRDFDPHKTDVYKHIEDQVQLISTKWNQSEANILIKDL